LKPRPKEINAVIADMVGVGPLTPGDPDVPLCVSLWYVTAYDPEGNKRGTGIDTTLAGAAAAAWVLFHDEIADQFGRVPLGLRDFDRVPRHVPCYDPKYPQSDYSWYRGWCSSLDVSRDRGACFLRPLHK